MRFEAAPAHALQAFAGGLLLQHRERDQLAHAGELRHAWRRFRRGVRERFRLLTRVPMNTPKSRRAALQATAPRGERSHSKKFQWRCALAGIADVSALRSWEEEPASTSWLLENRRAAWRRSGRESRGWAVSCGRSASFFHMTMSCAQFAQCSQCCSTWRLARARGRLADSRAGVRRFVRSSLHPPCGSAGCEAVANLLERDASLLRLAAGLFSSAGKFRVAAGGRDGRGL